MLQLSVIRPGLFVALFVVVCIVTARSAQAQQVNLTGDWVSTYACPETGVQYPLRVRVVHHGQFIVGVRLSGDQCLRQDNLTVFQGQLSGFSSSLQCATYRGRPSVLRYVTDSIRIENNGGFVACQARFTRERAGLSQPPAQQQQSELPWRQTTGAASCTSNQWYSGIYKRCFAKRGRCSQYNGTDSKTCNTRSDRLVCDWDVKTNTCYAE